MRVVSTFDVKRELDLVTVGGCVVKGAGWGWPLRRRVGGAALRGRWRSGSSFHHAGSFAVINNGSCWFCEFGQGSELNRGRCPVKSGAESN